MTTDPIFFKNREVAAYRLLDVLPIDKMKLEDWTVLSTSCSGYPIASIIAKELNAKLDMMFSKKIYAPSNNECEIAIVTEAEEVLIHEELVKSFDINLDLIYGQSKYLYENELSYEVSKFRNEATLTNLNERNILLIDEGLNTGLTMMACIKSAIKLGAKSISVATPVIPTASIQTIESIADDLYYVEKLDHFISINFYYDTLEEIKFKDIETIKKD
ncbi:MULTISPECIES: phosphoribosyltransferase [Arcobacteraceae]|uniref:ABC transporter n=1 Tax=Poseidonibacter parvus TaxID=1850254 RepID=A0A1P8KMC1_9BACT|nr:MULTISPECIES: phosphoribosyltransferase family protein [Arcobacteraceae]APW65701.1 ABC transporter [Poseidonibacter parvus]